MESRAGEETHPTGRYGGLLLDIPSRNRYGLAYRVLLILILVSVGLLLLGFKIPAVSVDDA